MLPLSPRREDLMLCWPLGLAGMLFAIASLSAVRTRTVDQGKEPPPRQTAESADHSTAAPRGLPDLSRAELVPNGEPFLLVPLPSVADRVAVPLPCDEVGNPRVTSRDDSSIGERDNPGAPVPAPPSRLRVTRVEPPSEPPFAWPPETAPGPSAMPDPAAITRLPPSEPYCPEPYQGEPYHAEPRDDGPYQGEPIRVAHGGGTSAALDEGPPLAFTARQMIQALPESSRQALREQVERKLANAFDLAERHAFHSARREFELALRIIAEALDAQAGDTRHIEALAGAMKAMDEADDFFANQPSGRGPLALTNIVVTHQTAILHDGRATNLTSVQAMQAYFAHAQQLLLQALGGEPYAAHALYGLGKVHLALANENGFNARLSGPKSLLMHQVAVTIDPNHVLSANELGVLLARYGQIQEAKQVLQATRIDLRQAEVWHNLAVVHERLGEFEWAASARQHFLVAEQQKRQYLAANAPSVQEGSVTWIDVESLQGALATDSTKPGARHSTPSPATATRQAHLGRHGSANATR